MAGAMRKIGVYLGIVEDDDRYDGYDEYDDYDETASEREPARGESRRELSGATERSRVAGTGRDESRGAVATLPPRRTAAATPAPSAPLDRITTIHPRAYNDAKTIGETFRGGTPVIMNVTDMEDADAKRLVDFAAGLVFGLHGTIERVTNKVFLLSPVNVSVTAEDKARMAQSGFFNQS